MSIPVPRALAWWRYALAGVLAVVVVSVVLLWLNRFATGWREDVQPAPIWATSYEAFRHRPKEARVIRVDGDRRFFFENQMVVAKVDPAGRVLWARSVDYPPLRHGPGIMATDLVRSWHFEPFVRHGKPVTAMVETSVEVLPYERRLPKAVPFPAVKDWNSVRIVLGRGGCLGSCPIYKIEVHGDGTVLYDGRNFVGVTGTHRAHISPAAVRELVELFRRADYFSLLGGYAAGITDAPGYCTSITIDGVTKVVNDYVGLQDGMPSVVRDLEEAVDRISGSARWVSGNDETGRALDAEGWPAHSTDAEHGQLLMGLSERGNAASVAYALTLPIAARAKRFSWNDPINVFDAALSSAAQRGEPAMIKAILAVHARLDPATLDEALIDAAGSGNVESVRLLVAAGARVRPVPSERHAIVDAAATGKPEVVRAILALHPNVNARNKEGYTAMQTGAEGPTYQDYDPDAVDRAEVLKLLLDAGAAVDEKGEGGRTALFSANQDPQATRLLIRHGANVNARSDRGETPIMWSEDPDVALALLNTGADPRAVANDGTTPLKRNNNYYRWTWFVRPVLEKWLAEHPASGR